LKRSNYRTETALPMDNGDINLDLRIKTNGRVYATPKFDSFTIKIHSAFLTEIRHFDRSA